MKFQQSHFKDFYYLGSGAFALVVKANNTKSMRQVALKIISCSNSQIQHGVNAMEKEYKFLRQFYYNDYTVQVFDCFYLKEQKQENEDIKNSQNSFLVMEMELCKCSLKNLLDDKKKRKDYPDKQFIEKSAIQMLDGLNSLHIHNIIHRDIKPQNFLISQDENSIKICDLGFASSQTKSKISSIVSICRLISLFNHFFNQQKGTESYFEPEIENKQQQIEVKLFKILITSNTQILYIFNNIYKSDLFSLGLVFLELDNLSKFSIDQMNIEDKEEIYSGKGILSRFQIDRKSNLYQIIEICLKPNYKERTSAAELLQKLIILHKQSLSFLLYSIIIENQLDMLVKVIINRQNENISNKFPFEEEDFLKILQYLYQTKKYIGSFYIVGLGNEGIILGTKSAIINKDIVLKIQKINSIEKIENEIQIMKEIQMPLITQFYSHYLIQFQQEKQYAVFELERCLCSLTDYLERSKKDGELSEEQKMNISLQIIDSVNYMHSFDIIHRDIKPDNFLIIENNDKVIVKLNDFGFSVKLKDKKEIKSKDLIGPIMYCTPENFFSDKNEKVYSKDSDTFSVGLILCHLDNYIKLDDTTYIKLFMEMMYSQIDNPPFYPNYGCDIINRSSKIYEFVRQLVVFDRVKRKPLSFIIEQLPQQLFSKKQKIQNIISKQKIKENPLNELRQFQIETYYENKDQSKVEILLNNSKSTSFIDITDHNIQMKENQISLEQDDLKILESSESIITQAHHILDNQQQIKYLLENNKIKFTKDRVFLIVGDSGVGKSSFIQKITRDNQIIISNGQQLETKQCNLFKKNGLRFIDTPGMNASDYNQFQILLTIVQYLHMNQLKLQDIFTIYVQNNQSSNSKRDLAMLSYTYFLYEIFKENINSIEVEQLIEEYFQSSQLLNWSECGFHYLSDGLSQKRALIFTNRDKASDYYQQFSIYQIVVITKFDKNTTKELEVLDEYKMKFLREQVWTSQEEEKQITELTDYKEYILKQEEYLFNKIDQIIENEIYNQIQDDRQFVQNILLLGNSQVWKSSLIEQITSIKGLRGFEEQQMSYNCQMSLIMHQNIKYRFINAQVQNNTGINQDPFQSFKIIADFLRRNKINEFKIVYMKSETGDDMEFILKQIQIFLLYLFDQDQSFVDTDFLNDLYQSQSNQISLQLLRNKIIQIDRIQSGDFHPIIQKDENQIISIQFFCSFFNDCNDLVQIDRSLDDQQQNNLFKAINLIEPITIEDKIQCKMELRPSFEFIENQEEYEQAYQKMNEKYELLKEIQLQIIEAKQIKNVNYEQQLLQNKLAIIKNIKSQTFILVGQISQIKNVEEYTKLINPTQKMLELTQNKLQNNIYKHFIALKFQPILFECTTTSKNVLISRKQNYYAIYYHQLKHFIQNENNKHLEILENLAKTKMIQEIILQQYLQQKYIELHFDRSSQEVLEWVEVFSYGINAIFGSGVQLYKYSTYFSQIIELSQSQSSMTIDQKKYFISQWIDAVFASLSIGIDVYQQLQVFSNNTSLNSDLSLFNVLNQIVLINLNLIAGIALIEIIAAIKIYQYVQSFNTISNETYDQTIGLFYKRIIDDQLPNQSLLYFQKSDFLSSVYQISRYKQLKEREGYEILRKLNRCQYDKSEQKIILQKLFNTSLDNKLKDQISYYISSNIISSQLQLQEYNNQNCKEYLSFIYQQMKENQQIIDTFYSSLPKNHKKELNKSFQRIEKHIIKQLEVLKKDTNNNRQIDLQETEKNLIQQYRENLIRFRKFIKENSFSYDEQKKFGNRFFHKTENSPILFNSYCNLIQEKTNYLFEQQKSLIQELEKDNDQKCLQLNSAIVNNDKFLKYGLDNQNLIVFNISEKQCQSRYLQKIKGEDPNLTYISQQEMIDDVLEYSIDLQQLAEISIGFEDFVNKVKRSVLNSEINLSYYILKRLQSFYNSYVGLKKIFI